ncbi:MAG: tRNA epoxyqueuosine(34) reductase QueG [Acidobacteria bacterium]|nr:MAG: tRNA epoxyqueuosine(34) reductase QueG [Acidobacteriota bacterium]
MEEREARIRLDGALIEEAGRRSGFDACGAIPFGPPPRVEALDRWLAAGAHAGMEWMARTAEIRRDPRRRWPWARSALVGAVHYLRPPRDRRRRSGIARFIARYALGDDYHGTVKRMLGNWADEIARAAGVRFRSTALVDTSAVLEREYAAAAGLGWIGKNTCLIGPRGDSWRFIGILLTDLEPPPPPPPVRERCGSCRACLDACPTGALPEPWYLDARRCISYLTIEHRGPIPEALREGIGDWLFGCDVCQEVCPWNRRVTPHAGEAFRSRPELERLELEELLAMDDERFRRTFRGSPLRRAKRAGLVRNALIVAANTGARGLLGAVRRLERDPEPAVSETARWAAGRLSAGTATR